MRRKLQWVMHVDVTKAETRYGPIFMETVTGVISGRRQDDVRDMVYLELAYFYPGSMNRYVIWADEK